MRPVLVAASLVLAACSARAKGPFPHAVPLPPPPGGEPVGEVVLRPPGVDRLAKAPFFRGLEHLTITLPALALDATPLGADPKVLELDGVDEVLAERARVAGRRAPRILLVLGFAARLSKPPAACAEALLDPAVLRSSLDADDARLVGEQVTPPRRARSLSMALLNKGKGPFRYDFRWTFRAHRVDLDGGAILLRYDLQTVPPPERVSAFEAVAVIEPDGTGSRLTEAMVLGTDISVPFFLLATGRKGVKDILDTRSVRLVRLLR